MGLNKRVKELAEQAGYSKDFLAVGLPNNMEKFAELIVRECTKMVRESSLPDAYSEPCLQAIADDIMEHFGIE